MNIFTVGTGNNANNKAGSVFAGNLRVMQTGTLKSTQEKLERQQKASNQIEYWENQKENLKNMECDTVEEIAKKLEMFHNYEDEIAAVKASYNREQMSHVLDEAREMGEKIAKAVEKSEPKTPEERREEMLEEALGTDENKGLLEEMLEEAMDAAEELSEEVLEKTAEELTEEALEKAEEELSEDALGKNVENEKAKAPLPTTYDAWKEYELQKLYRGVDIKV